jgi:hypothetical protein
MVTPILLAVLAAPVPPVSISLVISGYDMPTDEHAMHVLDALAPAGLEALPGCRFSAATADGAPRFDFVDDVPVCNTMLPRGPVCAEVTVTVTGYNAALCAVELVSAPWPRAFVYSSENGPSAALVWWKPVAPAAKQLGNDDDYYDYNWPPYLASP